VLVLELRTCRVSGIMPCDRPPANLPEGCVAVRCHVRTTSGAATTVVLGGPASGATGAELGGSQPHVVELYVLHGQPRVCIWQKKADRR